MSIYLNLVSDIKYNTPYFLKYYLLLAFKTLHSCITWHFLFESPLPMAHVPQLIF